MSASTSVSFTGSAEKTVAIGLDVIPRAAEMPSKDIDQCIEEALADECVITGLRDEGIDRLKEPQGRIDRVVLGRVAGIGKSVGEHPPVAMLRKSAQDPLRFVKTPWNQRKSRESDHRVAAPVREPGITGDDGFPVLSATHDELVGRKEKIAHKSVRGFPTLDEILPPADLCFPDLLERPRIPNFRRRDQTGGALAEVEPERKRVVEIFMVVKPALSLLFVFEVVVPVPATLRRAPVVIQEKIGQTFVRPYRAPCRAGLDLAV